MTLHVIRAEYIDGHRVHLGFNDGSDGEADLADVLEGPIFEPLKDPDYFRRFRLIGRALAWENAAEFAPEYLHELLRTHTAA